MRKLGLFLQAEKKPACKPRPCRQMTCPGQRIQVDVKVALRRCIANPEMRLFQYTAIDEFARLRFLAACSGRGSYSSADFLKKMFKGYARRGIEVACVQTDYGPEFTNRFLTGRQRCPSLFGNTAAEMAEMGVCHKRIRPYTPRHNGKAERSHRGTRNVSVPAAALIPWTTLQSGSPSTTTNAP